MKNVKAFYNPAQLFTFSFIMIILTGCLLLMAPFSTQVPINFIDALFTATSAVCVTGLTTLDTGTAFTPIGHFIIILLIQIGGLGILTFTNYFAYFFKGASTYENQIATSNFSNNEKLGEVFLMLKRIIIITFSIELVGAIFIFLFTAKLMDQSFLEHLFFSVFHSISSFCNAGFSVVPDGLTNPLVNHNYAFQMVLIILIIFGGLGFPIVINILKYLKHVFNRIFKKIAYREFDYKPWVININSKINLITTLSITVFATILIFILEYDNILVTHEGIGKFVTALFTVVSPRTAGYNSIDYGALHIYSILFIILLMWIGASPNSTGGGIKTSTFAVAVLNILSLVKGKERVEVFQREIAGITIKRAFAIMTLSLFVIGCCIISISVFDPECTLVEIAFECFSAYSTVGLTLGITAKLSAGSKITLIILMFIGRVTMLTIMIAMFKKVKFTNYRYAKEELTIN